MKNRHRIRDMIRDTNWAILKIRLKYYTKNRKKKLIFSDTINERQ